MLAGLAEAVALAEGIGVDPAQFLAAIEGCPLGSGYASVKGAMMINRSHPAAFPLHVLTKDVGLVADAATAAGVPLKLPAAIRALLADAERAHADDEWLRSWKPCGAESGRPCAGVSRPVGRKCQRTKRGHVVGPVAGDDVGR